MSVTFVQRLLLLLRLLQLEFCKRLFNWIKPDLIITIAKGAGANSGTIEVLPNTIQHLPLIFRGRPIPWENGADNSYKKEERQNINKLEQVTHLTKIQLS